MLSIDTNVLLHGFNRNSPLHERAYQWLASIPTDTEVGISELVLAELYCLLRNPAVVSRPLNAASAVSVIRSYRAHPRWRLLGFPMESRSLHDRLWELAGTDGFAFRRIYDLRTALTLVAQGVTDFATTNVKDFRGAGFARVWDPLKEH
jgi:uncharacterized protein